VKSISQLGQHTSTSLISKRPEVATPDIAMIDDFDAGKLEDDFFDDAPDPSLVLPPVPPPKVEEHDDLDSSNPMVTADEDLVGNGVDDVEDDDHDNIRHPIKFSSDLDNVWKLRQNNTASTNRISDDSSDDDLITGAKQMNLLDRRPSNTASLKSRLSQELKSEDVLSMISDYSEPNNTRISNLSQGHNFVDSSFDIGGYTPITFGAPSAYEEIGEGQNNPWLDGDSNQQIKSTSNSSQSHKDYKLGSLSSDYRNKKGLEVI
jgi:hypothetical protein